MNNKILRLIAIAGTIAFALKYIFLSQPLGHNQYFSYFALAFTVVGVAIALFIFRKATFRLIENPDILVPAGLFVIGIEILELLPFQISKTLSFQTNEINLTEFSLSLILAIVLSNLLVIFFAGWQTSAILQAISGEKVDPVGILKKFKWWFPRSLAAVLVGWSLVYLVMILAISVNSFDGNIFTGSLINIPYIFTLAIASLVWNLIASLLLPNLLISKAKISEAILEAMKLSFNNLKKIALPVVLQMLIIGSIVFLSVSFKEKTEFGSSSSKITVTTSYEATFFWTGSYYNSSKWNEKLLKTVKSTSVEAIDFKLMLLLLLLAVVIKIQIIEAVWGNDKILGSANKFKGKDHQRFAVISLIIFLLYIVPFERAVGEFNYKNLFGSQTDPAFSVENNPYFEKELIFQIPKNYVFKVVGSSESEKVDLRGINDVEVGELDAEPGRDIFILSGKNSLVFNKEGEVKNVINFKLDEPKDGDWLNHFYGDGVIVDVDGDGIIEFFMYDEFLGNYSGDLPQAIFNQDGEQIWKYTAEENKEETDKVKPKLLASGKVEKNKPKQLFIIDEQGIELFDLKQNKELAGIYSNNFEVFKDGQTGELLALNKSNKSIIKNTVDEPLKIAQKPFLNHGFIIDSNNKPLTIYFENEQLGLFDFDGKLIAKNDAPRCDVDFSFSNRWKAQYNGDKQINVFNGAGTRFSRNKDNENIAVMAHRSGEAGFTAMLYIYDVNGNLLLQDFVKDSVILHLYIEAAENGSENLLIVEGKKFWRYKAK